MRVRLLYGRQKNLCLKRIYKSQKVTPTKDNNVKDLFIRKNDTPNEDYDIFKTPETLSNNIALMECQLHPPKGGCLSKG